VHSLQQYCVGWRQWIQDLRGLYIDKGLEGQEADVNLRVRRLESNVYRMHARAIESIDFPRFYPCRNKPSHQHGVRSNSSTMETRTNVGLYLHIADAHGEQWTYNLLLVDLGLEDSGS